MHIQDPEQRLWLQERMEPAVEPAGLTAEDRSACSRT